MARLGRPHLTIMLEAAKETLDRIFGSGGYTVEPTSEYTATLRTDVAEFEFSDDPRDFVAASIIAVSNVSIEESPLDTWMSFLGRETPPQSRRASFSEQMQTELECIEIVVEQILSSPATARDASWFVKGYNKAYNDWASAGGSWTKANFDE